MLAVVGMCVYFYTCREQDPRIADVFVESGPFLKTYRQYIQYFTDWSAESEQVLKKYPLFAQTLKEFEVIRVVFPIPQFPDRCQGMQKLALQVFGSELLKGSLGDFLFAPARTIDVPYSI